MRPSLHWKNMEDLIFPRKVGGIFEKLLDFTEKFYIIQELVNMHCRQILAHMNPCGPSVQKEVQPRMAKISANYEVVFIMDGDTP